MDEVQKQGPATEKFVRLIENDAVCRTIVIEALQRGATPSDLVLLIADYKGIDRKEIGKHPECPTENNFKYRTQKVAEASFSKYLTYLRNLAPLPLDSAQFASIRETVRNFMLERNPKEFWRYDGRSRLLAASLLKQGATLQMLAVALSLSLNAKNPDLISRSSIQGWVSQQFGQGLDVQKVTSYLETDVVSTVEQRSEIETQAAILLAKAEARTNEHAHWKKNNEARAVVAALLEMQIPGTANAAEKMLVERFKEQQTRKNSIKSSLLADIQRLGLEIFVKKLRDGIYLPDDEKAVMLQKAADSAENYSDAHEAQKDVNWSIAGKLRRGTLEAPVSDEEREKRVLEQQLIRKAARHGGDPVVRNPKKNKKQK